MEYPFKAVIFDLDGVITETTSLHSQAWKKVFDDYLEDYFKETGVRKKDFSIRDDYYDYVDGKPRYDGVRDFLLSRRIKPEEGSPEDSPEENSICGIGNRKNLLFNELISQTEIQIFSDTVELIRNLHSIGIRTGVASSSANCLQILERTGLKELFEVRIDGVVSKEMGLKGKPAPDIFIRAASELGVPVNETIIVEDATSGVEAGKMGNFGLVVGVARKNNREALLEAGADLVVEDLGEVVIDDLVKWFGEGIETDNWQLTYYGYDPQKEHLRETLLSVGNGYYGTRGAMEETDTTNYNYPGTYISGVFNKLESKVAGRAILNEDFVNVTNWLPVNFRIGKGRWMDINNCRTCSVKRTLSLSDGMLTREMVIEDKKGRQTRIISKRVASMHNPHLAAIEYSITPLNYSGRVNFRSLLSGNHINQGVSRYKGLKQQHLKPMSGWTFGHFQHLEVATTQSNISIKQTARVLIKSDGLPLEVKTTGEYRPGESELVICISATEGETLTLEKLVWIEAVLPGADSITDPLFELNRALSFERIYLSSAETWRWIWNRSDIRIHGDRLSQKLIRLHLYHLLCTTSPNNTNVDYGIPARGLNGEAYRGHIFWDELFILPIYNLHFPEVARSVLMYRYRRLDAAREMAESAGCQGALFPWQSGSSGHEETQVVHYNPVSKTWGDDYSYLQRHVSLAIAMNIIRYHHATNDFEFLENYGAEMLIEICRFWAGKAKLSKKTGRYSIAGVMGPDEFHEKIPGSSKGGVQDNTYTNVMVSWLFREMETLLSKLPDDAIDRLSKKIDFNTKEPVRWMQIVKNLNLVISDEGILSQFDGYFKLKELDWDHYKQKYGDIHRLDRILKAEGKSPDQYKVSKQADVLMLFYNLGYDTVRDIITDMGYALPDDFLEKNFDFYFQRTCHGSTLSCIVHAQVAAMLNKDNLAWKLYQEALTSDFYDIQGGTTAEGIHAGVMAATVMMAINQFGGVNLSGDNPVITPRLPGHWKSMQFSFLFRGDRYEVDAFHTKRE